MKKTVLFIMVLLVVGCSAHTSSENGFETYRYNPFQFPYPEYYLKADIVPVKSSIVPDHFMMIELFGISFKVDMIYADKIDKRNETYSVKHSGKLSFVVMSSEDRMMGCNETVRELEKDYCSAFSSTEEFHRKLFLLTPEDLSKKPNLAAGNRWIVHRKGFLLEHVQKIQIYELKDFTIYRKDIKPSSKIGCHRADHFHQEQHGQLSHHRISEKE